jgi:hypothetical protein
MFIVKIHKKRGTVIFSSGWFESMDIAYTLMQQLAVGKMPLAHHVSLSNRNGVVLFSKES